MLGPCYTLTCAPRVSYASALEGRLHKRRGRRRPKGKVFRKKDALWLRQTAFLKIDILFVFQCSSNQNQQPTQQQPQNVWNTWSGPNQQQNNTWGGMNANNTWSPNNSNQQMQNPWGGWPNMNQQQQPMPGSDPWGMNSPMQAQQQANGDGMWNNNW